MSIPPLQTNGELPPGEHPATLDEIKKVYGNSNDQRRLLMRGLRDAAAQFAQSGVKALWVNGSFVTDKDMPNDIDGCWEYNPAVVIDKLDPVFLMRSRHAMKNKYGLDFLLPISSRQTAGCHFRNFFK